MTYAWQMDVRSRSHQSGAILPPSTVDESAWDILLALYSDARCEVSLEKLAVMVSVPSRKLHEWLAKLEERELISGVANEVTNEVRAVLSNRGRALLDRYLSATSDLQTVARH
jgi:hypothetical protein